MKPIFVVKMPENTVSVLGTSGKNKLSSQFEDIKKDYHVILLVSPLIDDFDFQVFNGTKLSLKKQIQLVDMFKDCKIYEPEVK
jgi:hypothetical protein